MPANTNPVFVLTPNVGKATITSSTTANTKSDGTGTIGTDMLLAFTAGANGSLIYAVRFTPVASTAATATTSTTLRAYLSTQTSGATTNANTFNLGEVSAAAQTVDHSLNAIFFWELPINKFINSGWTVLVSTHLAAAANTAWQCLVWAGDY